MQHRTSRGVCLLSGLLSQLSSFLIPLIPQSTRGIHIQRQIQEKRLTAVALSGGVDSAVAALLLKQQGHNLFGVFMQNWDEAEELGNANCSVQQDFEDAQEVSKALGIPLYTANFVKEYWTEVFSKFISQCERGLTPNPDLLCNKAIKFDLLCKFARNLGAQTLATGHYARLQQRDGSIQLLRAKDKMKDQSFFLASVSSKAFKDCVFPLGDLHKSEVREIAAAAGLHNAQRHSSVGICFIGKRKFGDFLSDYAAPIPGKFVDVDSGRYLGACSNIAAVTYGQRAGPGGASDRMYVVGKDIPCGVVYLALGRDHPALYTHLAVLRAPVWVAGSPPASLLLKGSLTCMYKARYAQQSLPCEVRWLDIKQPLLSSQFTRLQAEDLQTSEAFLEVTMPSAARAITPQQEFVLYDGDLCLGSAPVLVPGPTLLELSRIGENARSFQS